LGYYLRAIGLEDFDALIVDTPNEAETYKRKTPPYIPTTVDQGGFEHRVRDLLTASVACPVPKTLANRLGFRSIHAQVHGLRYRHFKPCRFAAARYD
jgi:hypothetical protein